MFNQPITSIKLVKSEQQNNEVELSCQEITVFYNKPVHTLLFPVDKCCGCIVINVLELNGKKILASWMLNLQTIEQTDEPLDNVPDDNGSVDNGCVDSVDNGSVDLMALGLLKVFNGFKDDIQPKSENVYATIRRKGAK